jgi:hypothetical protein
VGGGKPNERHKIVAMLGYALWLISST